MSGWVVLVVCVCVCIVYVRAHGKYVLYCIIRWRVIFTCKSFPCSRFYIFYSAAPWQSCKPNILLLWKEKRNETKKIHTTRNDDKERKIFYIILSKWWFFFGYFTQILCLRRRATTNERTHEWARNKQLESKRWKNNVSMHRMASF